MVTWRDSPDRPDLFDKIEVGRTYHHLTCIGVRPIVLRCDCGTEVRNRSLTHLNNGTKSCGCRYGREPRLRNEEQIREAERTRRIKVLRCKNAEAKTRFRRYDVQCTDCGECYTMAHERLADPKPAVGGCAGCAARRMRAERRARRDALADGRG